MTGLHRRRKRQTTTADYAAMAKRINRGYGRRIAADPSTALRHLRDLETSFTDDVNLGLHEAVTIGGHSPTELADMLGISRQAIYKRVALGQAVAERREREQRAKQPAITAQVARPRELTSPGPGAGPVDDLGRVQVVDIDLGRGDG